MQRHDLHDRKEIRLWDSPTIRLFRSSGVLLFALPTLFLFFNVDTKKILSQFLSSRRNMPPTLTNQRPFPYDTGTGIAKIFQGNHNSHTTMDNLSNDVPAGSDRHTG
jgi:hypothetical protein